MIQAPFFALFNFVANNRWAQIALTIGLVIFLDHLRIRHVRARERRRHDARVEAKARRVQEKVRETSNEKSAQVAIARDTVRPVSHSDGLSERQRQRLFGDRGNGG